MAYEIQVLYITAQRRSTLLSFFSFLRNFFTCILETFINLHVDDHLLVDVGVPDDLREKIDAQFLFSRAVYLGVFYSGMYECSFNRFLLNICLIYTNYLN